MKNKIISTDTQLSIDQKEDQRLQKYYKEKMQFWYDFAVYLKEERELITDQTVEEFKKWQNEQ